MTRTELATASDLLKRAANEASDADDAERLEGLADKVDAYATADRGPDHGQLARIENALSELGETTTDDALAAVEDAHEHLKEYRSGVEGV